MSTSVNTIKQLLWILLGTLVITYLISLNMENHFIALNIWWFSNDFLFVIAGGVFASLIVVLVCEIIRYRQLKLATEATLFLNLGNLYGQLLIIRSNCKRALNNRDIVADNLIQSTGNNAAMYADNINVIDFTPFCSNNKIKDILAQYKAEKYQAIKSVLINLTYLQIAIREDQKSLLQQGNQGPVTSDLPKVNRVLNKIVNQSTTALTYFDQIILQIDNELGNRYHWQGVKQALNIYQENYTEHDLNDFLKNDVIVF